MKLKSGLNFYRGKMVKSGNIIELYNYQNGIFTGGGGDVVGRAGKGKTTAEQQEKNRELVLMRARRDLRRIVNANVNQYGVSSKFVTLTFAENMKDIDIANKEFRRFIKRLNYRIYGRKCSQLKYSAVIEFQRRGAVHYHVIFYNLPYVKAEVIEEVWGNGFIKINKIDDIDNVGAYICKYLTKVNADSRLKGRKCYFNSRGLKKPVQVYFDDDDLGDIKKTLPDGAMTYKSEFNNEYLGKIEYEQYHLGKVYTV